MSEVVIPRINSSMFREYMNQNVRVAGQVLSVCINSFIQITINF